VTGGVRAVTRRTRAGGRLCEVDSKKKARFWGGSDGIVLPESELSHSPSHRFDPPPGNVVGNAPHATHCHAFLEGTERPSRAAPVVGRMRVEDFAKLGAAVGA